MEEIEVIIKGRVQLVMYRDFARRKARGLGLVGFVENRHDGSVIIVTQGPAEKLKKYVTHLNKGPFLSKVESVSVTSRPVSESYLDFSIHY